MMLLNCGICCTSIFIIREFLASDYQNMLTRLLGHEYKKNSETIYEELKDKQQDAIKHAKRLLQEYEQPQS
jgi:hypothetical protein